MFIFRQIQAKFLNSYSIFYLTLHVFFSDAPWLIDLHCFALVCVFYPPTEYPQRRFSSGLKRLINNMACYNGPLSKGLDSLQANHLGKTLRKNETDTQPKEILSQSVKSVSFKTARNQMFGWSEPVANSLLLLLPVCTTDLWPKPLRRRQKIVSCQSV